MMSQPYEDFQRDGFDKLLKLGKALCKLVLAFAPVIRGKYAGNAAIIALLVAVENLCPLIGDAETEFRAFGTDDPLPPVDTGDIAGINPSAPPPPELEIT